MLNIEITNEPWVWFTDLTTGTTFRIAVEWKRGCVRMAIDAPKQIIVERDSIHPQHQGVTRNTPQVAGENKILTPPSRQSAELVA